jgi:hypothetical protein
MVGTPCSGPWGDRQASDVGEGATPTLTAGAAQLETRARAVPEVRGSEERVSSVRVERPDSHAPQANGGFPAPGPDECLDFVRFCYRRRRVAWPQLYDEMCLVAARGAYRGLGYAELAERGIQFCLTDLPRLAELTHRVLIDEQASLEPGRAEIAAGMALVAQPARA